jgi:hypothetical protein
MDAIENAAVVRVGVGVLILKQGKILVGQRCGVCTFPRRALQLLPWHLSFAPRQDSVVVAQLELGRCYMLASLICVLF